ncbi:MAG: DNA polymerase IV [Candidatus Bathyarchaeota archaeon]|nr:MAG: DNA polymerase IV [Candidatus Bathyarchaeota archaeon]
MLVEALQPFRVVMHVDFDYFFAQVEERENPEIKGKPVVICVYSGRGEDRGAVSTANYMARKYGVKSGMPIAFARKRLKNVEAEFLPVNHRLYDGVSEKIMALIHSHADSFEQAGIDEAFLEVTQRVEGSFEKARCLAIEIKRQIFAEEKITCSIGVGPNKLVAKIAAGKQKPDGLTIVKPEEVQPFLLGLPVRELVGVGRKTEKTLRNLGVKTVEELAAMSLDRLIDTFGRSFGSYLHKAAHGVDESPVQQRGQPESVSRMVTLKEDTRDIATMMREIASLARAVHSTVVAQRFSFRSVSVIAVMEDLTMRLRSKTFEKPIKNLKIVEHTAEELLKHLLREELERSVRRVGVKIHNFIEEKGQKELTDFVET